MKIPTMLFSVATEESMLKGAKVNSASGAQSITLSLLNEQTPSTSFGS